MVTPRQERIRSMRESYRLRSYIFDRQRGAHFHSKKIFVRWPVPPSPQRIWRKSNMPLEIDCTAMPILVNVTSFAGDLSKPPCK